MFNDKRNFQPGMDPANLAMPIPAVGSAPGMPVSTQRDPMQLGGDGVGIRMSAPIKAPEQTTEMEIKALDEDRIQQWNDTLMRYRAGKAALERRIITAEDYWKLRHWQDIRPDNKPGDPEPASGWLVNTILAKHSDAMDAYPEPVCLAREQQDKPEAQSLSSILPVVMEQNDFAQTWSDVWWYKLKSGTGVYGVFWDPGKLNGLGDISIEKVDILNLFWEPGVKDIQKSRYVFHVSLIDNEVLEEQYPQLAGRLKGYGGPVVSKFRYDESIRTDDKSAVVDVYYKRQGQLHFAKYVNDTILYSTEDNGEVLYEHGKYPFVFDPLFPEEGYPGCGYGYVDLCKDPQKIVDILNNALVMNAVASATPRWYVRTDGGVNEEEYADLTKKFVHVTGRLDEDSVRRIQEAPLPPTVIEYLNLKVQEMKETSGNRDVNNGGTSSGATAASAIAAMQEAGNGLSRDMISGGYRAVRKVTELCIELIRQFYTLPRRFRITSNWGQEQFIEYTNAGLQMQMIPGLDPAVMQARLPVLDVKIRVQRESTYTKQAYNELAIQLYQLGVFNPQNAQMALPMLQMMDFEGRDELIGVVQQQAAAAMAMQAMLQAAGGMGGPTGGSAAAGKTDGSITADSHDTNADGKAEHWQVERARDQAESGAIPR